MTGKISFMYDSIHTFADQLGLVATIDAQGVLRKVHTKDTNRRPQMAIAGDNEVVLLETLRRTVQNMLREGVQPEAVIAAVKKMAYETVVDEVHDL